MKILNTDYDATTIVFGRPLYNGGRLFIKYNAITKKYYSGNTASTAVGTSAPITINGVLQSNLKSIARNLDNLGYTEYKNDWSKGVDTYGNIKLAGL